MPNSDENSLPAKEQLARALVRARRVATNLTNAEDQRVIDRYITELEEQMRWHQSQRHFGS